MSSSKIEVSDSPSFVSNNLAYSFDTESVVYINDSNVFIHNLSFRKIKKLDMKTSTCDITSINFISLGTDDLLAITSSKGVQIWNAQGSSMRYFAELHTFIDSNTISLEDYMIGTASFEPCKICIGDSRGYVHILEGLNNSSDDFRLVKSVNNNSSSTNGNIVPVTAISTSDNYIGFADEYGNISFHSTSNSDDYEQIWLSEGNGSCCTSLVSLRDSFIGGYSSGVLKVFRADLCELVFEITAHARCIQGLSVDHDNSLIASVSEDQLLSIWSFDSEFSWKSTHRIDDRLLVGVAFIEEDTLIVSAYDDMHLHKVSLKQ